MSLVHKQSSNLIWILGTEVRIEEKNEFDILKPWMLYAYVKCCFGLPSSGSLKTFAFNIVPDEKRHIPASLVSSRFGQFVYMSPAALNSPRLISSEMVNWGNVRHPPPVGRCVMSPHHARQLTSSFCGGRGRVQRVRQLAVGISCWHWSSWVDSKE